MNKEMTIDRIIDSTVHINKWRDNKVVNEIPLNQEVLTTCLNLRNIFHWTDGLVYSREVHCLRHTVKLSESKQTRLQDHIHVLFMAV